MVGEGRVIDFSQRKGGTEVGEGRVIDFFFLEKKLGNKIVPPE